MCWQGRIVSLTILADELFHLPALVAATPAHAGDRIVRADVDAQRHVHARGIAIVGQLRTWTISRLITWHADPRGSGRCWFGAVTVEVHLGCV
jgi:hypothetical protein